MNRLWLLIFLLKEALVYIKNYNFAETSYRLC